MITKKGSTAWSYRGAAFVVLFTKMKKSPEKSFGGENFRSDAKAQCLFSIGSAYRTYAVASTALDASLCVDLILAVALGNSVNGALVCASAAADAIVTDLISHNTNLLLKREPVLFPSS